MLFSVIGESCVNKLIRSCVYMWFVVSWEEGWLMFFGFFFEILVSSFCCVVFYVCSVIDRLKCLVLRFEVNVFVL